MPESGKDRAIPSAGRFSAPQLQHVVQIDAGQGWQGVMSGRIDRPGGVEKARGAPPGWCYDSSIPNLHWTQVGSVTLDEHAWTLKPMC